MKPRLHKPGLVVLFGSGEMSPTGRRIHELVFARAVLTPPVSIGILETPTGYEVNAIHGWPERMQNFFEKSLKNYKPRITRIRAWKRDGPHSTNDPVIVDAIIRQAYLYCGAGSPGYTIAHLRGSLAWKNVVRAHKRGTVLCLGSATAVAIGKRALPVYEIFKTGADLHWIDGLDFFSGYDLAIVPHWNNREGEDFDTTRCWMGRDRFETLRRMLPAGVTILGIDEQTACIADVSSGTVDVVGKGNAYILRADKQKKISGGASFSLADF